MSNIARVILVLLIFVAFFAVTVATGYWLDNNHKIQSAMPIIGGDYLTAWKNWKYVSGMVAAIAALLSFWVTRPKI